MFFLIVDNFFSLFSSVSLYLSLSLSLSLSLFLSLSLSLFLFLNLSISLSSIYHLFISLSISLILRFTFIFISKKIYVHFYLGYMLIEKMFGLFFSHLLNHYFSPLNSPFTTLFPVPHLLSYNPFPPSWLNPLITLPPGNH